MNKHTRSVSLIDGHTEEMTEAEIIKALECCIIGNHCRSDCPYDSEDDSCVECTSMLAKDALDLIKRQQTDIEKLEKIERFATKTIEKQTAEIERLNGLLIENDKAFNKMTELYNKAFNRCKTAKSEAIKEFAERLCEGRVSNDPVVIAVKTELKMTEVSE